MNQWSSELYPWFKLQGGDLQPCLGWVTWKYIFGFGGQFLVRCCCSIMCHSTRMLLFSLLIFPLGHIISSFKLDSYHLHANAIQLYLLLYSFKHKKMFQLNADKTVCNYCSREHYCQITIKADVLNLGIIFDPFLNFDAHIKPLTNACLFLFFI